MTTHNALTDDQAVAFLAIASMSGRSASGAPTIAQLKALAKLPQGDRQATLGVFAEEVKARMAPEMLAEIHRACAGAEPAQEK